MMCAEFFVRGWPSAFSKLTSAKTEDERNVALSSCDAALKTAFSLFSSHPPPPMPTASTSDIKVGWYIPLTSSPSQSSSIVANNTTNSAQTSACGEKRNRNLNDDIPDRPAKRLKASVGEQVEQDDVMDTDAEPSAGKDAEDGMMDTDTEPSAGKDVEDGMMDLDAGPPAGQQVVGDMMDLDAGPSAPKQAEQGMEDSAMDLDAEPGVEDSLNGRIRSHVFGIPYREFSFERVTYLS